MAFLGAAERQKHARITTETAKGFNGIFWSEREDLNLRPLVSQTSALTGLRHAPMLIP
jgi:hypothetical protein